MHMRKQTSGCHAMHTVTAEPRGACRWLRSTAATHLLRALGGAVLTIGEAGRRQVGVEEPNVVVLVDTQLGLCQAALLRLRRRATRVPAIASGKYFIAVVETAVGAVHNLWRCTVLKQQASLGHSLNLSYATEFTVNECTVGSSLDRKVFLDSRILNLRGSKFHLTSPHQGYIGKPIRSAHQHLPGDAACVSKLGPSDYVACCMRRH